MLILGIETYCDETAASVVENGRHIRSNVVATQIDIHKKFEFGLTSEIEGMFGNLRTFIRRMYHHTTPKYLPEYVGEFCLRFSSPEIFISPYDYLEKTL